MKKLVKRANLMVKKQRSPVTPLMDEYFIKYFPDKPHLQIFMIKSHFWKRTVALSVRKSAPEEAKRLAWVKLNDELYRPKR